MQLPRGTFREIKKGSRIGDLLEELERTKFSGISSISSPTGTGTLVYKKGACILVKFKGVAGDKGWGDLHADPDSEVDAALSTLDDAQIQLALDFNKNCRVLKPARITEEQKKPAPHAARPAAAPATIPPRKPAAAASLFRRPAAAEEAPSAPAAGPAPAKPRRPAMPAPPVMPQQTPPATGGGAQQQTSGERPDTQGASGSFENDIDTFDTMDLDNVTDKIRNDCKTMIKQLHLEHLMER